MLYYFHALLSGDMEGAVRYLTAVTRIGPGGDRAGFQRAVVDLSRRFVMRSAGGRFSIAQLILESVRLGGKYRVFFPVEMTLMVKALVTFEGVGRMLNPGLDVAGLSERHIQRVFRAQFAPGALTQEWMRTALRNAPEIVDLLAQFPELVRAGISALEEPEQEPVPQGSAVGMRSSIMAGFCLVAGVLALVQDGPMVVWVGLFVGGLLLYVFSR